MGDQRGIQGRDPQGAEAVHLRAGSSDDRGTTTHHGRHQVAHRAEQQLRAEAGDQGDGPALHVQGDQVTRGAEQLPRQPHQTGRQPDQRGADRVGGEVARALSHRAPHQRDVDDRQPGEVAEHGQTGQPAQPGQGADDAHQHRDQHRPQGPASRDVLLGLHLRPQHGGPQRDQRPHGRQTDETADIAEQVGQQQTSLPGLGLAERHEATKHGAQREQHRRHGVETDCRREPGRERRTHLGEQGECIPGQRRPDDRGTRDRDPVPLADHARGRQRDAEVEQHDPAHLEPSSGLVGAISQEGIGEVLSPHENRVGDHPEGEHVDEQPARLGYPAVHEGDDDQADQPNSDRTGGGAVPGATVHRVGTGVGLGPGGRGVLHDDRSGLGVPP